MAQKLIFIAATIALFGLIRLTPGANTLASLRSALPFFTESAANVSQALAKTTPDCTNIRDCGLMPGDILIRRYVTDRTRLFDMVANPFFTHAAFYLGDGEIVEATGKETDPRDEIRISRIAETDWTDAALESFVVMRPQNIDRKMGPLRSKLVEIANDPEYRFGISKPDRKQTSCAELIARQLAEAGMIDLSDSPTLLTPDYLFVATHRNKKAFTVAGYKLPN